MKNSMNKGFVAQNRKANTNSGGAAVDRNRSPWDEQYPQDFGGVKTLKDVIRQALGLPTRGNESFELPDWIRTAHDRYENGLKTSNSDTMTPKPRTTMPESGGIRPGGWKPENFRQLTEALKQGWTPKTPPISDRRSAPVSQPQTPPAPSRVNDYRPGDVTPMRRLVQKMQSDVNHDLDSITGASRNRALTNNNDTFKINGENSNNSHGHADDMPDNSNRNKSSSILKDISRVNNLGKAAARTNASDIPASNDDLNGSYDPTFDPHDIVKTSSGANKSSTVEEGWEPSKTYEAICYVSDHTNGFFFADACAGYNEYKKKKLGYLLKNDYAEFEKESNELNGNSNDLTEVIDKIDDVTKGYKVIKDPVRELPREALSKIITSIPKKVIENAYNYAKSPFSAPNISMMEEDYGLWEANDGGNPGERHLYAQFMGFPWEKYQQYERTHKGTRKDMLRQWITQNPQYWKNVELKALGWQQKDLETYNNFIDFIGDAAFKQTGL